MDKLSHMIADRVNNGIWKPMRAGGQGPFISHLMFADDLLLFSEASIEQLDCIQSCLDYFCRMLGQKVSVAKTRIIFSKNVQPDLRNRIANRSGYAIAQNLGRTLALSLYLAELALILLTTLLKKLSIS